MSTTHAREFQKPVTMLLPMRLPKQPKTGSTRVEYEDVLTEYRFEDYLAEHVWKYPKWNEEDSWQEAQIRIGDAVAAAKEGEMIRIEELDDWEKLHEANKKADVGGPNAHRVRRMQKVVKGARAPQKEASANGEAKPAPASQES